MTPNAPPAGPTGHPMASRPDDTGAPQVLLRLLATSDIHATILSYDYSANRPLFGQGLAQAATLIQAARAEVPGAILLDNGDFLQGTALADLAASQRRRRPHPVIAALNALGYDAAALGNHEFNFGLDVLRQVAGQARFPLVSANVLLRPGSQPLADQTLVPPFALLDRDLPDRDGGVQRLRIGVLGLTPPEILHWDRQHLQGRLATRPMLETACAWVPEMRRQGADLVVCLAHTGIPTGTGIDSEGRAIDIAALDGVDCVVAGHTHRVFPGPEPIDDPRADPVRGTIAGKPAVQPGHSGSHLGVIDLGLRRQADGWRVVSSSVRCTSVSEVVAGLPAETIRLNAEPLRKAILSDHRAALVWTRRTLGTSELPLSTCFAQAACVPAMRLLAGAKIAYLRTALSGQGTEGLPIVATATPYRSGGRGGPLNYTDIPAGPLSVRHLFDLYPFPNTMIAYRLTGADLVEQIERAAALFRQIELGQPDQILIDAGFPSFAFTTFHGVTYRLDLAQPARYDARGRLIHPEARRVRDLCRGGHPVRDTDRFILATNTYRSGGTLGIPPPDPRDVVFETRVLCTDVLRQYLTRQRRITSQLLPAGPSWSFAPLPGTSVLLDTGIGALSHLDEARHLQPDLVGLTGDGFHRFRLSL